MPSKILSIEIGTKLTRVAEIDYKVKNPKIYNLFSFVTPPDMLGDASVNVNSVFVSQLSNELQKRVINTRKATFVMNSTRVANRVIQIPYVKENRIADLLNANASDYFPIDMEQYQLVHETLGTIEDEGEKKLEISVLAVPKELVESYRELAKACGLALEGLDYVGSSIKKMMVKEIQDDIRATLKVDENISIFTIMKGDAVKLQRTINYGVGDVIDGTIESQLFGFSIDFLEAVEQLSRRTCVFSNFERIEVVPDHEEGLDPENYRTLRAFNTECFRPLIGSTSRILDYYQAQNPEEKIEKIYLVGIGSVIGGLSRLMTNELNCKVVANQQYSDISLAKNAANETVHIAEFFTAIGAAMNPVSIATGNKKAEKTEKGKSVSSGFSANISLPSALLCLFVCTVIGVAVSVYALVTNTALKNQQKKLNTQVEQASYIEDVVAEYNAAKADESWLLAVDEVTSTHNDDLVALIEEFEQKMPAGFQALTFSATEEGITMNITLDSKAAAADVISQMRTFSSIDSESIAISAISESKDDAGISTVSLSVTCSYRDGESAAADDAAAEEVTE
jgi:type IV pilus assembly protein PilM